MRDDRYIVEFVILFSALVISAAIYCGLSNIDLDVICKEGSTCIVESKG